MEKPITKVCFQCGSDNVMHDAWAVWDEENQMWELGNTFDHAHCGDCKGQTTIIDKELEEPAQAWLFVTNFEQINRRDVDVLWHGSEPVAFKVTKYPRGYGEVFPSDFDARNFGAIGDGDSH